MRKSVICLAAVLLLPAVAGATGPMISPFGVAAGLCASLAKSGPMISPYGAKSGPMISPFGAALEWICTALGHDPRPGITAKPGPSISSVGEPQSAGSETEDPGSQDLGPTISPFG